MGRLLNCCGRRKKILLDLKESMLGPFMLLALRGDSSFIQVSGALLLKQIIIVDVICTVHRKSPVNNWTIVSGPWNSERNTCTCICTYQSQLLLLSFWLNNYRILLRVNSVLFLFLTDFGIHVRSWGSARRKWKITDHFYIRKHRRRQTVLWSSVSEVSCYSTKDNPAVNRWACANWSILVSRVWIFRVKFLRKTHDETAAWKIYDNKLKCSLKEKCKRK